MKTTQYHLDNQAKGIAKMKRRQGPVTVEIAGMKLTALPNVYDGSYDTELMCQVLEIAPGDTVLDLCTGTGAIAAKAAQMGAAKVVAVDLNPDAVRNAELNKRQLGLDNMEVRQGSLFEPVKGMKFDVVTINPPYINHKPADNIEICFWDDGNAVTKMFFANFRQYLRPGAKIFFAWGDFADMELLDRLSSANDVKLELLDSRKSPTETETFLAYRVVY